MKERKKKIIWHTDHCSAKTGYGRLGRAMLTYLHNTGKYEIIEYSCGVPWSDPRFKLTPWRGFGALPDNQQELSYLNKDGRKDEGLERLVYYGAHNIDRVIKEQKPDIYWGINDPWAFIGYPDKPWWNKINSFFHITLDSLPIYQEAIKQAKSSKKYYVWAKFSEDAMRKMGIDNVETLHGAIDTRFFYRLPEDIKRHNRSIHGIPQDAFVVGYLARNQLRKSFPNLIDGFSQFFKRNPKTNPYLLLHTNLQEGWNILELMKEHGVPNDRVLFTYICRSCRNYHVRSFCGFDGDCKFCGVKAKPEFSKNPPQDPRRTGQCTVSTAYGVTEAQLNEIYNIMDVGVSAFTSGAQEYFLQEIKLTEKIVLATNYSCGEEYCTEESGGLPLDFEFYREPGSQFLKSTTKPYSIVKNLEKVYNMKPAKRREMEKKARKFILNNFDISVLGKKMEEIFDSCPFVDWDFNFEPKPKNPHYPFKNDIKDDKEWVKDLYKNILNMDVLDDDDGLKYWLDNLNKGADRKSVYDYFVNVAIQENSKNNKIEIKDLFDDNGNKRVLFSIPRSIGDIYISTSLFKSIKEIYPNHDLYIATEPQYFPLLDGNEYVYKVIPYSPIMDNELVMCGAGNHNGFVDVLYNPTIGTQKILNYLSIDKFNAVI